MVLFQRFSWGCCAGPPLESYEVVDDDVERAILRLVGTAATATSPRHFGSLEDVECMQRPKPRTMASLICVHSFLGCPLIAEGLSWKSPANKENDKQRNNN